MKKYYIFIFACLIIVPMHYSIGATTTGFIPGQIWYSKEPIIEGDSVKIYTALFNSGVSSLTAKVEFYDKNVLLGSRDIVVPSMKVEDVSVSWKVTSGDHQISAKIISPSIISGGKKEPIIVENNLTETDRKFIPVILTTIEGKPATSSDVIKSQLDKATSSLDGLVPESISTPVTENVGIVDSFRVDTFEKINDTKNETQKRIDELNSNDSSLKTSAPNINKNTKEVIVPNANKESLSSATDKPIAYVKLMFFSILSFIFGSKLVFYSLIIVVIFLILRGLYRKTIKR